MIKCYGDCRCEQVEDGHYVLYEDNLAIVQKLEDRVRELEQEIAHYEARHYDEQMNYD